MPEVTKEQILDALRQVKDPDLHRDIVSLGFVTQTAFCDGALKVTINLTTPACPVKDQMKKQAEDLLRALPGVTTVQVDMTAVVKAQEGPPRQIAPDIKHILAVSSGKGGVGKSTVAVNLACALAKSGARVGLLDCDVYGPDVPMMMGLSGEPEVALGPGGPEDKRLVPKSRHGVRTMSIGYLLQDDKPVVWRGPMVHKLIEQFLSQVDWGPLDYLVVDMPPGTGDAQLSLAQIVPLSGAVLVTTPQAVSTYDVSKAIAMFRQVKVDILGIVENMSYFVCPHCHHEIDIFSKGGGQRTAAQFSVPFLGSIELDPDIRKGGDSGQPIVMEGDQSPHAKSIFAFTNRVIERTRELQASDSGSVIEIN